MLRGGVSECRNKSLQLMFQQIGGGEKAGSGIDKIRQGWASQQWRWPQIFPQVQPDRVKLTLLMVSLLPESSIQKFRSVLGSKFESLNRERIQALVTADLEGSVTNLRLQQFSDLHTADISKMFGEMVASGYFVKDGYGRWASYRLNPGIFDDLEQSDNDSAPPITSSTSELSLTHNSSSSPHSEPSSPHSSPVLNDASLLAIANPSREKSRLSPEETEAIIGRLCSGRFLTYLEIGGLLGRDVKKTRDRFLSPMVTSGVLRLRFPNELSHPKQAYSAVETESRET